MDILHNLKFYFELLNEPVELDMWLIDRFSLPGELNCLK